MTEVTRESQWRTMTGEHVRIFAMSDQHLLNAIRVLRNRSPIGTRVVMDDVRRREWSNAMASEAYARGLTIDANDARDPVHE